MKKIRNRYCKVTALILTAVLTFLCTESAMYGWKLQPAVAVSAQTEGDYEYKILNDGTAQITGYSGTESNLTIPAKIGDYKVSEIGKDAFNGMDNLLYVDISEGIEEIGMNAFASCTSLVDIHIPASVKTIFSNFANGCSSLQEITVDSENKRYLSADGVLFGNIYLGGWKGYNLTTYPAGKEGAYTIPDYVRQIEDDAFKDCTKLTEVVFPEKLGRIGDDAFSGCTNLKKADISSQVTKIGSYAFAGCVSLSEVTLPHTLEYMDDGIFEGCINLRKMVIPVNTATLGYEVFWDCPKLSSIIIPAGVVQMKGSGMFGENPQVTVYGFPGTEAETYCKTYNVNFAEIPDESYTVSFDANGGTTDTNSKKVSLYDSYGILPVPQRDGYLFDGWHTEPEGGSLVTGIYAVQRRENHTLYAHWKPVPEDKYIIYYHAGYGSVSTFSEEVTLGETIKELPKAMWEHARYSYWKTADGTKITEETVMTEELFSEGNVLTVSPNWWADRYWLRFYGNGGTVDTGGKDYYVSHGYPYGELPVPKREGCRFTGWYTDPVAGELITADTIVNVINVKDGQLARKELYAHWEGENLCQVTYDYTGGWTLGAGKSVEYGKKYGSLPNPSRRGYTFTGWYTSSVKGNRITEDSTVNIPADHTLYAQWEAEIYKISFDANGGSVSPSTKKVIYGKEFGKLPVPKREGYTFVGWYTEPSGGRRVVETKLVTSLGATYYAHWESNHTLKNPKPEDMAYRFTNSARAFGYEEGYRADYSIYKMMYGDSSTTRELYDGKEKWTGSCFGMCATAAMFFSEEDDVFVTDYRDHASQPYELTVKDFNQKIGINLTQFIECLQYGQSKKEISQHYKTRSPRRDNFKELCEKVSEFERTGNNPVLIVIWGKGSGHTVIGYKLKNISKKESRIYIYDPNYSVAERYITLYKNDSGEYTGWYYYLNEGYSNQEEIGTEYPGPAISYVLYNEALSVWENRAEKDMVERELNLVNVNAENAVIYDHKGNVAAEIENGNVISEREDVCPVISVGMPVDETVSEDQAVALWLPVGLYTIKKTASDGKKMEVRIADQKQSALVSTDSDEVTFAVDDDEKTNHVQVSQEGAGYEITLSSTMGNTFSEVNLSGKTGEKAVQFSQMDGELIAEGADLEHTDELSINGEKMSVTGNTASGGQVSTSVENKICAKELYLDADKATMKAGETKTLTAELLPQMTTERTVTWQSDNPDVATVSPSGEITAVGEGKAVILASCGSGYGYCVVTVTKGGGNPDDDNPDDDDPNGDDPNDDPVDDDPVVTKLPFADVSSGDWFQSYVAYVYQNNLMKGLDDTHFGPVQNLARAQFAVILHRMNGEPKVAYTAKFPDVGDGIWYTDAILWASSIKVVNGYSDTGRFGPADYINREQMAVMMYRYADYKGYSTGNKADISKFKDASQVTGYAKEAMKWAYGNGIITGKDYETRLEPQGNASRAECATIIMRFVKKYKSRK